MNTIEKTYKLAKEKYLRSGINTEDAIKKLKNKSISLHCWQGDDVGGFETSASNLSGSGLQVTGNYPGKARNPEDLRKDIEKAFSLIPGRHRVNLHAIYGEFGGKTIDRNEIEPKHFSNWIEWAKRKKLGLDFNGTLFAHPNASSGMTLSSIDPKIRKFWIEHVKRCRKIAAVMGKETGSPSIHNLWISDGMKDSTVNRGKYRKLLKESLDEIYRVEYSPKYLKDSVESKLFGIGSESFVTGSHEFYLEYAAKNNLMLCLDSGHFHPTESIADKISAVLQFSDEVLLHVSRGIRWDSDHAVVFNDELREIALEIVRNNALTRAHVALDYFDASINRIGAWVLGARATQKALLYALLEPSKQISTFENNGNYFARLALLEEQKTMPLGAVWDYFCLINNIPADDCLLTDILNYEKTVLSKR